MKTLKTPLLILIISLGYCLAANAQITSAASGTWNSGTTWTGGVVPTSSDDVEISNSHIVTVSTIQNCDDLTINSGGTLKLLTSSNLTTSQHITVNGTLTVEAGILNAGNAKTDRLDISGGTLNFSGGIINIAGRYKQNNGGDAYLSGSAILNISTSEDQTTASNNFSVAGSGTIFSVGAASTVQIVLKYGNTGSTIELYYSPSTSSFDGGSFIIENTSGLSDIYIDSDMPIYNIESKVGSGNVFHFNSGCNFSMNNLAITSGNVQADEGAEVSINGTASLGGDEKFTIESVSASSTASVIFNAAPSNTISVQRYFTASEWHLFGVPVSGITANNLYLNDSPDVWMTSFDESSNSWNYITDLAYELNQNIGYMYWINGSVDKTINFTGNTTASNQTASLTNSHSGWNALGNPFISALDWDLGTWDPNTITTGTVYVWDQDYNSGDYRTWNGSTGDLSDGIIPLGQGFFVQATSAGDFTLPEAARVHDNQAFYKTGGDNYSSLYVRLQLEGENCGSTVFIGFPENGTETFDYRGDATKRFSSSSSPQLFVVEDGIELSTNANASLTDEGKIVPVNLAQMLDGNYSITISDLAQLPNAKIILEDIKTGITQDLIQNHIYNFYASEDDNSERFLLHFMYLPVGINDNDEPDLVMDIYSYGKDIYIRLTDEEVNQRGKVVVYDLMGRKVEAQNIQGEALVKIPINLTNKYVIVKVVSGDSAKTKMIFIE